MSATSSASRLIPCERHPPRGTSRSCFGWADWRSLSWVVVRRWALTRIVFGLKPLAEQGLRPFPLGAEGGSL